MRSFALLFCAFLLVEINAQADRIRLEDVRALTFHRGSMTNGRRSSPVPQLECIGGSARHEDYGAFDVVQCTNQGSAGAGDVQWACKADMDETLRFGSIEVNCEGYDSPYDEWVLKGSCGLRYKLERRRVASHNNNNYNTGWNSGSSYSQSYQSSSKPSGTLILILLVVGVIVAVKFLGGGRNGGNANAGAWSGNAGYDTTYDAPRRQGGWRPGFWTGALGGAGLGYMFGGNRRGYGYGGYGRPYGGYGGGYGGGGYGNSYTTNHYHGSGSSSGSGSSGRTHTSTGYGGTTRR